MRGLNLRAVCPRRLFSTLRALPPSIGDALVGLQTGSMCRDVVTLCLSIIKRLVNLTILWLAGNSQMSGADRAEEQASFGAASEHEGLFGRCQTFPCAAKVAGK